ncbi:hypothetical protein NLG97_g4416 [Lecanicillium saksenae]|uniref:Uncharacterized protein n=1 Tax=Lecanicillium saksenae TaxID=468837 RepID=A0ACC1QYM1_9HYPO|nr:hypothetical protein NLG97_g4416 [Lecanicillium saksenae]
MRGALLSVLATLAAASPMQQDMVVKHALPSVPTGWQVKSAAPPALKINMHIGLKEQNLDQLQQRLLAMSDPEHAEYGKHMSRDEVEALTAPSDANVAAVKSWLAAHGITAGDVSNGFLKISLTTAQAEKLLGTKYNVYHHAEKDTFTARTMQYSVPANLQDKISTIQPTTFFGDMGLIKPVIAPLPENTGSVHTRASCGFGVNPSCLKSLYNINYTAKGGNTSIGIAGYLGEVASKSDLSSFLRSYTQIPSSATFSVELVNGGRNSGGGTLEADLDTQYAMALTYPISNVFYETGGQPPFNPDDGTPSNNNEPYLDWLNYLATKDSVPQTMSSSYGDNEQTVPKDYADKVCDQFMKLGARGVSVLVSSGDGGVSGGQPSDCRTNDGSGRTMFLPTFPASCPWVTAVGGTTSSGPEYAASLSSGGFSNYYTTPDYQSSSTSGYLSQLGNQYSGMFNPQGRGIPDVAAQAINFAIVQGGGQTGASGTSCSAPTFAGIVALLNDYRASQGKAPLGFLNPFLYSKGVQGLNDITSGNNPGCNTNGFEAATGWDPVTGLGTPNFGSLKNLV